MAKDVFFHKVSGEIVGALDRVAYQAGRPRSQVFADWLEVIACALAGGDREEEYRAVIGPYTAGEPGRRGVDGLAGAFARLVTGMQETGADLLGDIFCGAITHGENGQFFTPEPVCDLMAALSVHDDGAPGKRIHDPACGSGRTLLAYARRSPGHVFVGVDVDRRCALMTAINLALHGLEGYAIWANTLSLEVWGGYRTGVFVAPQGGGALRWLTEAEARSVLVPADEPAVPEVSVSPVVPEVPPVPADEPAVAPGFLF